MIVNMLDISTAHITKETNDFLEGPVKVDGLTVTSTEYGYFISFVGNGKDFIDELREGEVLPSDLINVMEYASNYGAYFINLDADAEYVDALETYEW